MHAWFPVFVITGHDLTIFDSTHIYFSNFQWVTTDYSHKPMNFELLEGAFSDPGIPEVQDYTFNVLMDIVVNYDIDGIHLDYIRYPGQEFGYNELAVKKYKRDIELQDAENWQNWKEKQVSNFVRKVYDKVKEISENLQVTAAVIANPDDAQEYYSQNWIEWLKHGFIDKVYLMAYTTSTDLLENKLTYLTNLDMNDKIVVGLRSWSESKKYTAYEINEKIMLSRKMDFAGFALFSYSGIRKSEYFKELKTFNEKGSREQLKREITPEEEVRNLVNLARKEYIQGNYTEAKRYFERIVEINPNDEKAINAIKKLDEKIEMLESSL